MCSGDQKSQVAIGRQTYVLDKQRWRRTKTCLECAGRSNSPARRCRFMKAFISQNSKLILDPFQGLQSVLLVWSNQAGRRDVTEDCGSRSPKADRQCTKKYRALTDPCDMPHQINAVSDVDGFSWHLDVDRPSMRVTTAAPFPRDQTKIQVRYGGLQCRRQPRTPAEPKLTGRQCRWRAEYQTEPSTQLSKQHNCKT